VAWPDDPHHVAIGNVGPGDLLMFTSIERDNVPSPSDGSNTVRFEDAAHFHTRLVTATGLQVATDHIYGPARDILTLNGVVEPGQDRLIGCVIRDQLIQLGGSVCEPLRVEDLLLSGTGNLNLVRGSRLSRLLGRCSTRLRGDDEGLVWRNSLSLAPLPEATRSNLVTVFVFTDQEKL
jgi:hypothetical protein